MAAKPYLGKSRLLGSFLLCKASFGDGPAGVRDAALVQSWGPHAWAHPPHVLMSAMLSLTVTRVPETCFPHTWCGLSFSLSLFRIPPWRCDVSWKAPENQQPLSHSYFPTTKAKPLGPLSSVTQISTYRWWLCCPSARTKISARTSPPSRGHMEISEDCFLFPVPGRDLLPHLECPSIMEAHSAAQPLPWTGEQYRSIIFTLSVCRGGEILRHRQKLLSVTQSWLQKTLYKH